MNESDIEIILKVWHGKFDHGNDEDRAQSVKTYDKLITLKTLHLGGRLLARRARGWSFRFWLCMWWWCGAERQWVYNFPHRHVWTPRHRRRSRR